MKAAPPAPQTPEFPQRLWAFLIPYRAKFVTVYAIAIGVSLLELLPPLLTKHLIDAGISARSPHVVLVSVLGIAAVTLAIGALGLLQGWLNALASERTLRDMRRAIVGHLSYVPLDFFARTRRGEITNRIAGDIEMIRRSISRGILALASDLFDVVFLTVAVFVLDWRLASVAFASLAVLAIPVTLTMRGMVRASHQVNDRRDDLTSIVQRLYSHAGMSLMKSFGAQAFERLRLTEIVSGTYDARRRFGWTNRLLVFWGSLLVVFAPGLIWLVGGLEYFHGMGSVGTIVATLSYALRIFAAISMLSALGSQVVNASTAFERIRNTLLLPAERRGGADAGAAYAAQPEIALDGVELAYDDADERLALAGIDLGLLRPGYYAVVGPSGAGKSTMLQVLHKHRAPLRGSARIGATEVSELAAAGTRDLIALASQDAFLRNDTLLANVCYARPDAPRDEVAAATRAALVDDFALALPGGWSFGVGDRGRNLSGGQRQRVCIARALLKDAPVLVLDEATNELDHVTEQRLLSSVRERYRGRTVVHVTHRLSTVVDADRIFVVAAGRVLDSGTHAELLARCALYARLYEHFAPPRAYRPGATA